MVKLLCIICAMLAAMSGAARAGVILSPVAIVSNTFGANPYGIYPQENMINQSNVSPFVSGVDDFATYAGGTARAGCNECAGMYFGGNAPGDIDFDLGQDYRVQALGLFNSGARGVTSVDVYTSATGSFAVSTLVGSFQPSVIGDPVTDVPISVFDFVVTEARYVRLHINDFARPDGCDCLGIAEVTFEVSAVAEPTTLALLGSGAGAVVAARRRNRARVGG